MTTAFTLLLGAGPAFGLGNRELAGEFMRRWVERGSEKTEEVKAEMERDPRA